MSEEPTVPSKKGQRCPTAAELAAYALGGTSVGAELFDHLAECARCRAFVAKQVVGAPVAEGTVLAGRYRIEHLLATGGIGAVVRAVDIKLDRHVAIKMMLPHTEKDPNVRSRFSLEAKLATRMRSEHVARVLDVGGEERGSQYIVYEYLVGEDLTTLLRRRGTLPIEEACEHVLQACEAMAEAHSLGIIHRDLKPANLFLTTRPDGGSSIKVIDFGIAKTIDFGREGLEARPMLTIDKMLGTPRYMSPEQIKSSSDVDVRTDIWGFGVILYELVTGECPFDAPTVNDVFAKVLHHTIAPPRDLPAPLAAIIMRCLERDPALRPATVAELARDLAPYAPPHARLSAARAERMSERKIESGERPDTAVEPAGAYSTVKPTPRRSIIALSALTVAVVTAVLVIGLFRVLGHKAVPIGATCARDDSCGALDCRDQLCTRACTTTGDCPSPARCGDGVCSLPLRVGFIYVGVPEDEGWTRTHDLGRKYAMSKLPFVESDYVSNAYRPEDAARAVDDLVAGGYRVIVANSSSLAAPMVAKARQYPDVRFVAVIARSPGPAVTAINARMYEAWYLAGYAAAQKSRTHRLGYVGGLDTPEVVRDINAFARGAHAFDATVRVEVRWLGFWFDAGKPDAQGRHKEEQLAQALMDSGCDVIANHADNERVVAAVEQAHGTVTSIANNNIDACERGPTTCLGVPYWNWGPLYVELLDSLHHNQSREDMPWETMRANPDASVVAFKLNASVAGSAIALETANMLAELAKDGGEARVFEGPFCSTGQRSKCIAAHEHVADDELRSMCWFVDGVVDEASHPAQVPADCKDR